MSFTTEIKKEVASNELKECCQKAELSALIKLCSTLSINNNGLMIIIKIENATVAKRIYSLIKQMFNVDTDLSVIKKMNLKKNNIYQLKVLNKCKEILSQLEILTDKGLQTHPSANLIKKDCCARAYLAGAFMANGSINNPNKANYHLEIKTNELEHANFIQKLCSRFNITMKIIERRNNYIVYCKSSDKIADFMRCIGSFDALMRYEDIRITRDFRNNLTRLDNCELANETKSVEAATKQIADIELIKSYHRYDLLDIKLKEVAQLRIEYPDSSLNELREYYIEKYGTEISKSGIKHRLKKINDLANQLREKENL